MSKSLVAAVVAVIALCGARPAAAEMKLNGCGSSFDAPAFEKWFAEYAKKHDEVSFKYDPAGSGAGVKKMLAKSVDFGATDLAMTDAELAKNPGVVHVPIIVGAVSVAYNIPDFTDVKMSPATVAGIFMGTIKTWNDPKIAADNPGVELPKLAINVVHRTDGSGTTAIFTDFLSKVSPEWRAGPGQGEIVSWKVGTGAKGSDGVAKAVAWKEGSIGYVDLAHANLAHLSSAAIKNAEGKFVVPTILSASAAANAAKVPKDLRGSITNPPGEESYPIAGFSYMVVQKSPADAAKGVAVANFFAWVVNEGQEFSSPLDYAPLPGPVVVRANQILVGLGAEPR